MTSIWTGGRVRLRGIEPEDWEAFRRFDENSEDMRSADMTHPPRSAEGYRRWAEEQATRDPQDDEFMLAIEAHGTADDTLDNTLVGSISTNGTDRLAGRFSYGVSIGDEHKRRGYASEAVLLLMAFMFAERRYHKCEISVHAVNEPSVRMHEKLGFVTEGRLRDHVFFAGRHQDLILLGMTAQEFWARHAEHTPTVIRPDQPW
nr:GNAT family N-acetyltransferase [Kibdelosporangium sp. MJ126-NF4]